MSFYKSCLGVFMLALLIPAQLMAERAPLSPEALKAEATHVVTGLVKAVYSLDKPSERYGQGTIETDYLLEIEIQSVEKGDGLKPGDLVYARLWKVKKPGVTGTPGPYGHFIIPATDDRIRAFLTSGRYPPLNQSDNGWVVVYPNGIEELEKSQKAALAQIPTESHSSISGLYIRNYWWLLLIGFSGGVVATFFAQRIFPGK